MPKLFGRQIPPIVVGIVGLVGVYAIYNVLSPADTPVASARKFKAPVKKSSADTDYLLSDYTFKINPLPETVEPKDAFRPLVIKSGQIGANGVPSVDSYTYSGMASINKDSFGLLENSQTGQGDFVTKGQRWHDSWLVINIDPNEIQLRNDGGDITTLIAGAASQKTGAGSAVAAATGNTPVSIVGAIGGPDLTVQADGGQGNNNGNGNNGRRRRGRRGGGGGAPADGG
jgi:hypothetical protein